MLELRLDEATRVFISPCQMKANNGILIIDDFGRQVLSPRELLNRWIVPLDRRVDYLTLASGMKFQVPFELMVVFSTNLNPNSLADEAFLRRIQTKVEVEEVDASKFSTGSSSECSKPTRSQPNPAASNIYGKPAVLPPATSTPASPEIFTAWSNPSPNTKAAGCD